MEGNRIPKNVLCLNLETTKLTGRTWNRWQRWRMEGRMED